MSNSVKATNGAEVYSTKIHELADLYISELQASEGYTDEELRSLMRKPQPFKAMLKYIFNNLFKIGKNDIKYNNKNSNLDYGNIDLLNNIWDIYTGLCYKYLQNPTILNFSLLTGIDTDTFNSWKNGEYKGGEGAASSAHSVSAKKWLKECESALYDSAMTGNPGPMFLLKANYGYTEAPQQVQVISGQAPEQIAADIAARHSIDNTARPELPEDL